MENKEIVLSVKDLQVNFSTDHGYVQAVRGVSFDLYKGETLCIVGESGSGKSVTSKTIMGILAANGRIVNGSIMYEGEDLTKVSEDEFHRIRGHKIGMIFQDPLSSLNPIMRIGKQITEAMLLNGNRLKKMRDDLVAKEFVTYKNAVTEYNRELNKGKEAVKFFKSEKKKELERAKNVIKNETDGALYALRLDYGLEKVQIKHKYKSLAEEAKDDSVKLANVNAEKAAAFKAAKENFDAKKKEISENAKAKKGENKEYIAKLKAEFNQKIKEAKTNNVANKSELTAQYKTLIADAKAKYLAKKKEADKQVAEAKVQFAAEYQEKLAEAYAPLNALKAEKAAKVAAVEALGIEKEEQARKIKAINDEYAPELAKLNRECAKKAHEAERTYISKTKITKSEARERALKIMEEVGIPNPAARFRQYPFEFSGGMRQRIVIAIALTADPDILICDEPTTALDVTIQAQILELINRLKAERNISVIFITHDLGVVANMADRVAVMYAGKIVEYGKEEEIFYDPKHPYTWALLSSIPDVDSKERLDAIPGTPPNLIYPPKGDAFALRSKYAMKIDFKKEPPLFKISDTHYAATWLLDPRAPKVEMPTIVKTRIEASLAAHKERAAKKNKAQDKEDISNISNPLETHTVAKASTELEMEQHSEEVLKEAREHAAKKKGGKK